MTARRLVLAAAGAAVALIACGCTPLVERSYPGGPPRPEATVLPSDGNGVDLPAPDFGHDARWVQDGSRLAVTLGGSSTCPVEPTAVTVEAHDRLVVEIAQSGGWFGVCTADLGFTTYEIRVPDGVSSRVPVTVRIGDEDRVLPPRSAPPQPGQDDGR